ncbi:MAG: hypothetical protein HOG97_04550 [Candidatus Marinimicrobia bacterium]|jgi:type IV secretory pathway TrbD component|nr:hypothetical protein [Candidatus Neomarinimicrobiota bacterium]
MARGSIKFVNRATIRPLMIAGVEKKLALSNALLSFPLVAATHFHLPACFIGIIIYMLLHFIFMMISKQDPYLGQLIKRCSRYAWRTYFPAKSHPCMLDIWPIKSVSRPW